MSTHDLRQKTTFYEQLQLSGELDLRDTRGKKHDLAFVLLGMSIGLLRHRDGTLSSLHRSMVNTHEQLCQVVGAIMGRAVSHPVVSRAQLPRILYKVNRPVFEGLLFKYYQVELSEQERKWFAGDGKELRGSIEKGAKRGEVSVQLVGHEDRAVVGQAFYNGSKESEKPSLRQLIEDSGVQAQYITTDALHLYPKMTEFIHKSEGTFLIGLKDNQKELLEDMLGHSRTFAPQTVHKTVEKGHGRIETRQYACFDVSGEYFEDRWQNSGFSSLISVQRTRLVLKTNRSSQETSYYISNGKSENANEYFKAVRNHWAIEVNNHYRDVSLNEDQLRTKKSRLLGSWQA